MMPKHIGWIVAAVVVCGLCLLVYLSISTPEEDIENQLAALDEVNREQDGIHDWTGWGPIHREKMRTNAQATLDRLLTERNPQFQAIPATTVWTKGDTVTIRCVMTNVGKTAMKFVRVYQPPPLPPAPKPLEYPDRPKVWLEVRKSSGGDARGEIGIDENSRITVTENSQTTEAVPQLGSMFRFTGYPGPRYDEIVTILPGESLTYTMSVIVRWEPGAYRTQAVYRYYETVYEPTGGRPSGVEHGPSPAWKGEMRSNAFDVTVK